MSLTIFLSGSYTTNSIPATVEGIFTISAAIPSEAILGVVLVLRYFDSMTNPSCAWSGLYTVSPNCKTVPFCGLAACILDTALHQ